MASFADILSSFGPASTSAIGGTAGLFVSGSEKSVPLRIRTVASKVFCDASFADTTETFAFISDEDVNVVFKFPLPPRSAVYKLEATIGDRTIVTEVKPKQEAQAEFDSAVSAGNTAVIAKQEDTTQIFTLELGNLEAMQEAIVTLSYLRVLDSVGGALEWVHTSTWTPPYIGSQGDQDRGAQTTLTQNPRFSPKVAYSLAYDITLVSSRGIKAVESPEPVTVTDEPVTQSEGADGTSVTVGKRVTLSENVADPSKDLTLLIELAPLADGAGVVHTGGGYGAVSVQRSERAGARRARTVALASFVPRALQVATDQPLDTLPLNQELVLIVDCSGSMYGERITQARDAAIYFIKDLPVSRAVKFNIVLFGSNHVFWQSQCQDINEASMKSAVEWVREKCDADMGGTEMLGTVRAVYDMPVTPGYQRQIILLTDGGISGGEEQAMFELVSQGKGSTSAQLQSGIQRLKDKVLGRTQPPTTDSTEPTPTTPTTTKPVVHCLGIGHGVHRGLLDGLASRTGGVAQYVVDGESITKKAAFLSRTCLAGRSAIIAPRLVAAPGVVRAVPHALPPRLFPDQAVHVLVELDSESPPKGLRLEGVRGDGSPWWLELPLSKATETKGDAYRILHSMCYVSSLLDGTSHLHLAPDGTPLSNPPQDDDVKASVVAAAVDAHLVTRYTAAVGVLVQKDPLDPTKVSKVEVPLATPYGAKLFQEPEGGAHYGALGFGGAMPRMRKLMCGGPPMPCAAPMPQCAAMPMMAMAAPAPMQKRSGGGGGVGNALHAAGAMAASLFTRSSSRSAAAPAAAYGAPMPPPPPGGAPGGPVLADALLACEVAAAAPADPFATAEFSMKQKESKKMAKGRSSKLDQDGSRILTHTVTDKQERAMSEESADMECDADDMECDEAAAPAPPAAPAAARMSASDALSQLNLLRGLEGSWPATDAVMRVLVSQVAGDAHVAMQKARGAKLEPLTDEQWTTVLALAFLRKHCANERSTWATMESKAIAWLEAAWPKETKAVGFTVLGAIKLV